MLGERELIIRIIEVEVNGNYAINGKKNIRFPG